MSSMATRLLEWFDLHGRHDLPWQHPRTPYRVWVSETMLQQTQVSSVIPFFQRFVDALPDLPALAAAAPDEVLALWSGLGYYLRARHLQKAAQACMERHGGALPATFDDLIALPGIGRSTAGAILALAHNLPFPILDGNVRRILCRLHGVEGWPGQAMTERRLWQLAAAPLPATRIADFTQAMMDLGALLCTPRAPACQACPLREDCVARRERRVGQLPERRAGKALPTRRICALVARDDAGCVLLQRRPPIGIWAGLWSLPEASNHDEARNWIDRHAHVGSGSELPVIAHTLSHCRLLIQPLLWTGVRERDAIGDNDDLRWQHPSRLGELGLPAPVRKLLKGLG